MSLEKRLDNIRSRLPFAMLRDQHAVSDRVDGFERALIGRRDSVRRVRAQLASLERRLERSIQEREARMSARPRITYPENLPIIGKREEIIRAITENPVVIVSGDTGSGKSTQIPKMCLEAGRGIAGKIGCTQPRRIAASTIAHRISEELGERVGRSVGYKVRFQDRAPRNAYIKIMTDGMLLAETQSDPRLSEYDTLIIDEAHERTLNIDFLLGILKTLVGLVPDIRLIVSSATLDTEKFSTFFDHAPVIHVSGRTYPVRVEYMPVDKELEESGEIPYVEMAVRAVEKIHRRRDRGDILVFMPTEQDILETCEKLEGRRYSGTTILPLFARLQWSGQKRVYTTGGSKIVVATNVAETSLTIPGIKYVVDTGLARISRYQSKTRTTALPISPISQASADQRKGRCGRVQNGVCIRLYSEEDYTFRPDFTVPEILRSNLAEVILRMIALKLGDIASFPFLDKPNPRSIQDGFDLLVELGAISRKGKEVLLTSKGRLMSRMPLDPRISRMMIEAEKEKCVKEVAIIAAALSIQDPRERPVEKADHADRMHAPFKDPASDFITLFNIWNRYDRKLKELSSEKKTRIFCREHFLSLSRMREWRQVHEQIQSIMETPQTPARRLPEKELPQGLYERIHKSILSGFLSNIAQKKDWNMYTATRGREVMIFPGSTLFDKGPEWVVAAEMVKTSRVFARTVAKIESDWLESLGGDLCRSSYSNPHWEKNRGEVRALEQVALFGLIIVPHRSVSYKSIDPEESHRIFVQSALVEGEIKEQFPFFTYNRRLIEDVRELEHKVRRKGILAGDEAIADFYSRRLQGISDIRSLKWVIREKGGDDFLKMTEEDVLIERPDEEELFLFPGQIPLGARLLDCSYKFEPGGSEDGVTVAVPAELVSIVPTAWLEWGVPGLFREKITALIKGLPKRYRKQLVPVSKTVDLLIREMKQGDQPLLSTVSQLIFSRFGVDIPASVWAAVEIPEHLKMRISVKDKEGREIDCGRDIRLLERKGLKTFASEESAAWKKARSRWEKEGITKWDFGSLPDRIPVQGSSDAYPGLETVDRHVNIRLFSSPDEALRSHLDGVQELLKLQFSKDLRFLKRDLALPARDAGEAIHFGGVRAVEEALYVCLVKRFFRKNIRTDEEYNAHVRSVRALLVDRARELRDQAGTILKAYGRTRSSLEAIEASNEANPEILALCACLRKDLDSLMPSDFIDRYPMERLVHTPRYLEALRLRAERGANDLPKDRRKSSQVDVFVHALSRMAVEQGSGISQQKRDALEGFRWMIEEFRVSLFAQELKTLFPVSEKRLEKRKKEIERML